jgi:hypothetical protein
MVNPIPQQNSQSFHHRVNSTYNKNTPSNENIQNQSMNNYISGINNRDNRNISIDNDLDFSLNNKYNLSNKGIQYSKGSHKQLIFVDKTNQQQSSFFKTKNENDKEEDNDTFLNIHPINQKQQQHNNVYKDIISNYQVNFQNENSKIVSMTKQKQKIEKPIILDNEREKYYNNNNHNDKKTIYNSVRKNKITAISLQSLVKGLSVINVNFKIKLENFKAEYF